MNKQISYLEFRKAAYRHLNTCECLLKNIENPEYRLYHNELLVNAYYLSGYVVECSLKYLYFSTINYKACANVYDYKCGECDGCLKDTDCEEWKHHNIDKLQRVITAKGKRFSADIPYFGSKIKSSNIDFLFKERKNDVHMRMRYTCNSTRIDSGSLREYLNVVKDMCQKLIENY